MQRLLLPLRHYQRQTLDQFDFAHLRSYRYVGNHHCLYILAPCQSQYYGKRHNNGLVMVEDTPKITAAQVKFYVTLSNRPYHPLHHHRLRQQSLL